MMNSLIVEIEKEADKVATEVARYGSSGKFSQEIYEISVESFIHGAEFMYDRNNNLRTRILNAQKTLGYSVFQELLDIIDGVEDR